jgi:hypothetical protein
MITLDVVVANGSGVRRTDAESAVRSQSFLLMVRRRSRLEP